MTRIGRGPDDRGLAGTRPLPIRRLLLVLGRRRWVVSLHVATNYRSGVAMVPTISDEAVYRLSPDAT